MSWLFSEGGKLFVRRALDGVEEYQMPTLLLRIPAQVR